MSRNFELLSEMTSVFSQLLVSLKLWSRNSELENLGLKNLRVGKFRVKNSRVAIIWLKNQRQKIKRKKINF